MILGVGEYEQNIKFRLSKEAQSKQYWPPHNRVAARLIILMIMDKIALFKRQKFHIKNQVCIWWNCSACAVRTITKLRRNEETTFFANLH